MSTSNTQQKKILFHAIKLALERLRWDWKDDVRIVALATEVAESVKRGDRTDLEHLKRILRVQRATRQETDLVLSIAKGFREGRSEEELKKIAEGE